MRRLGSKWLKIIWREERESDRMKYWCEARWSGGEEISVKHLRMSCNSAVNKEVEFSCREELNV